MAIAARAGQLTGGQDAVRFRRYIPPRKTRLASGRRRRWETRDAGPAGKSSPLAWGWTQMYGSGFETAVREFEIDRHDRAVVAIANRDGS